MRVRAHACEFVCVFVHVARMNILMVVDIVEEWILDYVAYNSILVIIYTYKHILPHTMLSFPMLLSFLDPLFPIATQR